MIQILNANALRIPLADESVQCCLGWATGNRCGVCFVCVMVTVFREVHRVLRRDGVLWLNLGDCYVTTPPGASSSLRSAQHGDGVYNRRMKRQLGNGEDVDVLLAVERMGEMQIELLV